MDKLKMQSSDLTQKNIEVIEKFFPNVITEVRNEDGKLKKAVDFDLLKQELSSVIVEGDKERYQLTWPGKKEAMLLANTKINKTLRPVKEDSVDWDNTQNLYIEGDNLEVLKLLQESYLGKIKCIYIDPPYNTGKDFIYRDDFKQLADEYLEESGQVDENGNRLFQNTESNGRFHSDWLTMMYPRLKLARSLLRDDGVIFISIDDNEIHNLKLVCDEIFGNKNALPTVIRRAKIGGGSDNKQFAKEADYIISYAKNTDKLNKFFTPHQEDDLKRYSQVDDKGRFFWDTYSRSGLLIGESENDSLYYEVTFPDGTKRTDRWRRSKKRLEQDLREGEAKFVMTANGWNIHFKQRLNTEGKRPRQIIYDDMGNTLGNDDLKSLEMHDLFDYPKPVILGKFLFQISSTENSIILDFFSGSATTAHAVMQLNAEDGGNRKYIMVQLPEPTSEDSEAYKAGYRNICEIGKERIRRAAKKIKEETNADIDYGFRVFRVDSSNMKDVYYRPSELEQGQLEQLESNIKEERTAEDLLIQVMLDCGLELSLPMETREIKGTKVFFVAGNSLVACFDEEVPEDVIKVIAKEQPLRVVFRDNSFKDDAARINVEEIFKMLSPATEIKVI